MPRWCARESNLRCAIRLAARSIILPRGCWIFAKATASIATTRAMRYTMACLPVYRTYVRESHEVAPEDACQISAAIEASKAYRSDLDSQLFDFLREILMLRAGGKMGAELALRFQQISAAVTAKGVEDTAFYSFNRMVALNEVGGDPDCLTVSAPEFYAWCRQMLRRWPRTMLATSTHDTKRSEDVRARLFV